MRVAVLGSNGRSGKACVEALLAAGHTIRAGVHSSRGAIDQASVEYVPFDGTDAKSVTELITGCDAVVSVVGHVKGSPAFMQTDTIQNVITAMHDQHISRLISLTGTGVRLSGDKPSLIDRFLNFGIKLIDPKRINDGIRHAEIIQNSDVSWTIVRVLKLTNGQAKPYKLTSGGPAQVATSRATVAQVIVDILQDEQYYKSAPIISKATQFKNS
jgi:hypothetical protein